MAFQDHETTVRDWKSVAHDIAGQMARGGLVPAYGQPEVAPGAPPPPPSKPVFVRVRPPDSTFLREVADEFQADVLRRGGTLARLPFGATVVSLDVDVVTWSPGTYRPGFLPVLGDAFAFIFAGAPNTKTEAVWKATVEANDQEVLKIVEPVCVRDDDAPLYSKPVYPPLEARLIRYDP